MPQESVHRRWVELRFDGDRTVSGTLIKYGDTATLPWGQERFLPGAFGDLSGKDITLNVMHDRARIVARTNPTRGQAKFELIDTEQSLEARATLTDTTDGRDALQMIKDDLLRGFSVEFIEEETRREAGLDVQVRADLRGTGIVDRPAYGQSIINPRWTPGGTETEGAMGEKEIRALLEQHLKGREGVDCEAIAKALAGELSTGMRAEIDAALKDRDDERAAKEKAETDRAETLRTSEENAERRADLLTMVADLLPKDFDRKGKTTKEILVAAAGDEIPDAAERSEDYLQAKIETILERRKPDGQGALQNRADDASATGDPMGAHAIYRLREAS